MRRLLVIITIISLSSVQFIYSQNILECLDRVYRLNPTLYNGKQYSYFVSKKIRGHQFCFSSDFLYGKVKLKGNYYSNLQLNYDILNQQLLLKYRRPDGGSEIIAVSEAWLEKFTIGDKNFGYFKTKNKIKSIYQEIGNSSTRALYRWKKELIIDDGEYRFSKPKRESYIYKDNQILRYKNNRSLILLFSQEKRGQIKEYVKKNKINVKNASDKKMLELITFCNHL